LSFDLHGPVAAAAADQFEADWVAAGGTPAARSTLAGAAAGAVAGAAAPGTPSGTQHLAGRAQFLPSGPDQAEDTVYALLIGAFFQAASAYSP